MLYRAAAALFLTFTINAGCSMAHSDPENPKKNPHPVKRYEVTATSDAPGPWDSIKGYIGYEIEKAKDGVAKCVPMDSFLGEQSLTSIGIDIEMTRVDDHTWRGYLYRDALQDEDYYNLGACHWDVTGVSISTMAQGVRFAWSGPFEDLLHHSPETSYFKKSVYGDRSFAHYGAPDYSPLRPEYKQDPGDFFPVTLAVKEVVP